MEVKVNIAGQEMNVPVAPEQEAELQKKYEIQFMANFFRETSREIRREADFTTNETDCLVDTLFHAYPNPQELCEAIIADNYFTQVKEFAEEIVKERPKTYRVTVHYEGAFDVVVRAEDEREAERIVNDLSHYDLVDKIELADAEMEVDHTEEDDTVEEWEVDFDTSL